LKVEMTDRIYKEYKGNC